MDKADQLFTAGLWTAKPGKEDEFAHEWEQFARWTSEHQPGAGWAYLVRDVERPQRFIAFGPWESAEQIDTWRASPEFKSFVARIRELCDDFQPGTYRLTARIERR